MNLKGDPIFSKKIKKIFFLLKLTKNLYICVKIKLKQK